MRKLNEKYLLEISKWGLGKIVLLTVKWKVKVGKKASSAADWIWK
jgi:hypothetical protein